MSVLPVELTKTLKWQFGEQPSLPTYQLSAQLALHIRQLALLTHHRQLL